MKLQYVVTNEKTIDGFTNPLVRVNFEYFKEKLGVVQISVHIKRIIEVLDGVRPTFSMK